MFKFVFQQHCFDAKGSTFKVKQLYKGFIFKIRIFKNFLSDIKCLLPYTT